MRIILILYIILECKRGEKMVKLLNEKNDDAFYGDNKELLIADRFMLTIFFEDEYCTFFIDDKLSKYNSLELTQKIAKSIGLGEDPDVELTPSIDTCGISVPKSQCDEILKLIKTYLLNIK